MLTSPLDPAVRRVFPGGFTLVELLVALLLFSMLMLLVIQMIGNISTVTASSGKVIAADDQARMVFDRMDGDIYGMLRRRDVNPLFIPAVGNDQLYFYSQAPAFSTNANSANNSQIALVGYCVTTNGLQRLGQEMSWDQLQFTNGSVATNSSSTNFSILAPSVNRFEYALLMKTGATNNAGSAYGSNVFQQTNNPGQALNDVAGIIVALVILDSTSRTIISGNTNALSLLSNTTLFPDCSNTTISGSPINGATTDGIPFEKWKSNALSATGIPPGVRSQIRVYVRYFPLN